MSYTQGPWHTGSGSAQVIIYGPHGYAVADAKVFHNKVTFDEAVANARLIAAAPDLLAALKRLLATVNPGNADSHSKDCRCVIHEARTAIAKAEGWS